MHSHTRLSSSSFGTTTEFAVAETRREFNRGSASRALDLQVAELRSAAGRRNSGEATGALRIKLESPYCPGFCILNVF